MRAARVIRLVLALALVLGSWSTQAMSARADAPCAMSSQMSVRASMMLMGGSRLAVNRHRFAPAAYALCLCPLMAPWIPPSPTRVAIRQSQRITFATTPERLAPGLAPMPSPPPPRPGA